MLAQYRRDDNPRNSQPHCIGVHADGRHIPQELRTLAQWVLWRLEMRDGKWTKVPLNPRTLTRANSTDPATWSTFDEALAALDHYETVNGIGFVFSEDDPYTGVDFDKCIVDGELDPAVRAMIENLGSYAEYSPSGTGVHVIVCGKVPGERRKNAKLGVEMYDNKRFFTFTGLPLNDTALPIHSGQEALNALYNKLFPEDESEASNAPGAALADDEALLRTMFASRHGAEIERLWRGDTSGHSHDDSSADLALCNHLAFWTGKDAQRMDRLFRQSGLYRSKWERQDYREATLRRAIDSTGETYSGRPATYTNDTNETGPKPDAEQSRGATGKEKGPSQAELLYAMASERVSLFTAQDGSAYALVPQEGRTECHPLRSGAFRGYLAALFHENLNKIPGSQAIQDAIGLLEWNAREREQRVYVRVAPHGNKVYIDRGTPAWDAIEVDQDGWRIVPTAPVAFRRPRGMGALPVPEPGGDVSLLRGFLNVDEGHWPLLAAWTLAAYYPFGPYPVLVLTGEAGTAKTTTSRLLKTLIDPNTAALRAAPKNIEDLMIASGNSWVLAYDNLSSLSGDVSDALCRIATGGGYTTRALYTNGDEYLLDVMRPILLNGIDDIVTRGDLMDRALAVELLPIAEGQRKDEATFWRDFEVQRSLILGAFLTALSCAIGNLPHVTLPHMPRMADFAKLATAGEEMLGLAPGDFLTLYRENRTDATTTILDGSPIVRPLRQLVIVSGKWEGTPAELLEKLNRYANDAEKQSLRWPKDSARLSKAIKQLAPTLRAGRIVDARYGKTNGARKWTIERLEAC